MPLHYTTQKDGLSSLTIRCCSPSGLHYHLQSISQDCCLLCYICLRIQLSFPTVSCFVLGLSSLLLLFLFFQRLRYFRVFLALLSFSLNTGKPISHRNCYLAARNFFIRRESADFGFTASRVSCISANTICNTQRAARYLLTVWLSVF